MSKPDVGRSSWVSSKCKPTCFHCTHLRPYSSLKIFKRYQPSLHIPRSWAEIDRTLNTRNYFTLNYFRSSSTNSVASRATDLARALKPNRTTCALSQSTYQEAFFQPHTFIRRNTHPDWRAVYGWGPNNAHLPLSLAHGFRVVFKLEGLFVFPWAVGMCCCFTVFPNCCWFS